MNKQVGSIQAEAGLAGPLLPKSQFQTRRLSWVSAVSKCDIKSGLKPRTFNYPSTGSWVNWHFLRNVTRTH